MFQGKLSFEKKVLILVIVLFAFIAALSLAGYLSSIKDALPVTVQPTEEPTVNYNNETKNWNIYTDNKYWFQIKYSIDWHFNSGANDKSQGNFLFSSNSGNEDIHLKVFEKDADISKYQDMVKTGEAIIKTNDQGNFVLWFTGTSDNSERRRNLELILKRMDYTLKFIESEDVTAISSCGDKIVGRESNFCFVNLGKEKGLDICDKLDGSQKPYCYAGVGAVKNDSSICNNLENRNFCLGLVGGLIGDLTVCDGIGKEGVDSRSCKIGLARTMENIDDKFCETITESWKDACYTEKALIDKDSRICKKKVKVAYAREECFRDLAVFTQNAQICENIAQGACRQFYSAPRDKCFKDVAVQSGNSDICQKAVCGWGFYCYSDVAKKLNDINICKMINLEGEMIWPSVNCFENLAVSVNDVGICKSLTDDNTKDFCYFGMAQKFKDASICDNVQEVEARESCYKNIDK